MTKQQHKNAIAYLGKGYDVVNIPPPKNIKIEVITDEFNIFNVTYLEGGFWQVEGGLIIYENVVAWKHTTKK